MSVSNVVGGAGGGRGSLWLDMQTRPATCVVIACCSALWLYMWSRRTPFADVAYQYDKCVKEGQWWRVVTSSVSHLNVMHIVFNMASLWQLGALEQSITTREYVRWSFLLVIASMAVVTGITHIMITRFGRERQRHTFSLGYSCVVFGWMTINAQMSGTSLSLFGVAVPLSLAPFGSLILTSLLIPRASFIGHLAGIIVGYGISFKLFDWYDDYMFCVSVLWVAVLFVVSLRRTTQHGPEWLTVADDSATATGGVASTRPARTVVDGRLGFV